MSNSEQTPSGQSPAEVDASARRVAAIRGRSLKLNVSYAVFGTGLNNVFRFGVVILLGKFATPELAGFFFLGLALAAPVIRFAELGMRTIMIADAADEIPFGSYRIGRMLSVSVAAVVLLVLTLWHTSGGAPSSDAAPRAAGLAAFAPTLIVLGVVAGRILDTYGEIYWGLFQKDERMDLLAGSNILRGAFYLLAFALFLPATHFLVESAAWPSHYLTFSIAAAALLYSVAAVAINRFYERRNAVRRSSYTSRWSWRDLRTIVRNGLPLAIVTSLLALSVSIPRLLIVEDASGGERALGFFGTLSYIVYAAQLLVIQMGHASTNRLATYFRTNLRAFIALVVKLQLVAVGVSGAVLVMLVIAGEWMLRFFFTAEYAQYHAEFVLIGTAQCIRFSSSLLGFAITQMRMYWVQVPIQVLICVVTYVVAAMYVPDNPIRGGAYAILSAAVVHVVAYAWCLAWGLRNRNRLLKLDQLD